MVTILNNTLKKKKKCQNRLEIWWVGKNAIICCHHDIVY